MTVGRAGRPNLERSPFFALFPHLRPEWGRQGAGRWMDRFIRSGDYRLFIAPAPRTGVDDMASGDSVEHDLTVPPGSLLWGLTASSGAAAGFRFALWNEGRLMVPRLNWANLAGYPNLAAPNTAGAAVPYLLDPPYAVQGNLIHVKITNLATSTNGVQLVLYLAAPTGGRSRGGI